VFLEGGEVLLGGGTAGPNAGSDRGGRSYEKGEEAELSERPGNKPKEKKDRFLRRAEREGKGGVLSFLETLN